MNGLADEKLYKTVHDYFQVYLPKMRRCSENTIRSYRKAVSSLFDFAAGKREIPLAKLTFSMFDAATVSTFLEKMEDSGTSVSTRNQRLQAIRSFFSYAALSDPVLMIYKNEIYKVPIKKDKTQNVVDYLTEPVLKVLFEQPDVSSPRGFRDLFLLLLMYDSAARVQEVVDIRICDLTPGTTPALLLHGKGSKTRIVPVMQSTLKQYDLYMNTFHPGIPTDSQEYLFYSERKGKRNRLDTSTVRKMMQKYGDMARESCSAMPEKVHPHLLRHSRAMHLYQHGMDLTLISQWLGHAQLETTLIYAYADTEQKRRAIEQATPANSILKNQKSVKRFVVTDDDMIRKLYGLS